MYLFCCYVHENIVRLRFILFLWEKTVFLDNFFRPYTDLCLYLSSLCNTHLFHTSMSVWLIMSWKSAIWLKCRSLFLTQFNGGSDNILFGVKFCRPFGVANQIGNCLWTIPLCIYTLWWMLFPGSIKVTRMWPQMWCCRIL